MDIKEIRTDLPFITGMVYKSQTHPQFDMIIDFVNYEFCDSGKIDKYGTIICWCNINKTEFDKFIELKFGNDRETTYPYPFAGECGVQAIKQRIKKYNLEFVGMSDDKVNIYGNNKFEYCSGFDGKFSKLSY